MEALINEWAAKGYRLDQVVRRSTYQWLLIFSLTAGAEHFGSSRGSREKLFAAFNQQFNRFERDVFFTGPEGHSARFVRVKNFG